MVRKKVKKIKGHNEMAGGNKRQNWVEVHKGSCPREESPNKVKEYSEKG